MLHWFFFFFFWISNKDLLILKKKKKKKEKKERKKHPRGIQIKYRNYINQVNQELKIRIGFSTLTTSPIRF